MRGPRGQSAHTQSVIIIEIAHYRAGNGVDKSVSNSYTIMEVIIGMREKGGTAQTLVQWDTQEACTTLDDNDSSDYQIMQPGFYRRWGNPRDCIGYFQVSKDNVWNFCLS